jgi:hypothetical protein
MGTAGTVHYSKYLTGISVAYGAQGFVARQMFPYVKVQKDSDKIANYGTDKFDPIDTEAEGVGSGKVERAMGTPYSFATTRHALHDIVLAKDADRADAPINLERDTTEDITSRILLREERRLGAILTSTSLVTQTVNLGTVGANRQYNESAPTPKTDWTTAKATIWAATGQKANIALVPYETALYLAKTANVVDEAKYVIGQKFMIGEGPGGFGAESAGLPPVLWGTRIVIADSLYNSAVKGATVALSAVWSDNIVIGYVPPRPGLKVMSGGYTLVYKDRRVTKQMNTDPDGTKVLVEEDYDQKTLNLACFYLIEDCLG